jgi:hypothetical protein
VPLAEIEPDFKVPVLGSIQALIDKLDHSVLLGFNSLTNIQQLQRT